MKKLIFSILLGSSLLTMSHSLVKTHAEETAFTSVLEDLSKDSSFNQNNYVKRNFETVYELNNDDSDTNDIPYVEVIGLAEGSRKELFIYTYQPCNETFDLNITSVNMMDEFSSNGEIEKANLYTLELISEESVFNKYKVIDYTIPSTEERYYNIVGLYAFNDGLEDGIVGGEKNEVGFSIGQQWCAYNLDDSIVYEMNTFDILELDITTTGFIHMKNGLTLDNLVFRTEAVDAHYIGFSCDEYIIKHIYDADLNYNLTEYREEQFAIGTDVYTKDLGLKTYTITSEQEVNFVGKGLFAKSMNWTRILTASEYISTLEDQDVTFDEESKKQILSCDYVFSYLETDWKSYPYDTLQTNVEYSRTSNVTVLRLHFMDVHDDVYNLGVVSDKVTEDNVQDGVAGKVKPEDIWNDIINAISKIETGLDLLMLIIKLILLCLFVILFIWLIIRILRIFPIHKWIASLILLPFENNNKKESSSIKKRRNKKKG